MDFKSEHYFQASIERMRQAEELYFTRDNYALTMYVAGVAVESMLRAFMLKKSRKFSSRHDVWALFKESSMLDLNPDTLKAKGLSEEESETYATELEAAVSIVATHWHNNYRYASEVRVRAHLKHMKLYQKVKGDLLKANALKLLSAAQVVINKGLVSWR